MFITLHEVTATGELVKNKVRPEIITRLVPLDLKWSKDDPRKYHPETRVFTSGHGSTSIEVLESADEVEKLCLEASYNTLYASTNPLPEATSAQEKADLLKPFSEPIGIAFANMLARELPTPLELQPAPCVGRLSTSE